MAQHIIFLRLIYQVFPSCIDDSYPIHLLMNFVDVCRFLIFGYCEQSYYKHSYTHMCGYFYYSWVNTKSETGGLHGSLLLFFSFWWNCQTIFQYWLYHYKSHQPFTSISLIHTFSSSWKLICNSSHLGSCVVIWFFPINNDIGKYTPS